MRLIDADKLIEICDKGWRLGSAINTKIYHTVDASDIRSQPTVKAIPIEWIWKWYDEETHRLGDGWTHVEHPYSMKRMIADWEKENEID